MNMLCIANGIPDSVLVIALLPYRVSREFTKRERIGPTVARRSQGIQRLNRCNLQPREWQSYRLVRFVPFFASLEECYGQFNGGIGRPIVLFNVNLNAPFRGKVIRT